MIKIFEPIDMSIDENREFTLKQAVTNTNLIFENDAGDRQYASETVAILIIKQPY